MHRAAHPATQVNDADVASVKNAIEVSLAAFAKPATAVRPKLTVQGISEDRQELLHTLMDTYVKNDVLSIQQSIVNREQRGRVEPTAAACSAAAAAATAAAAAGNMLGCRWEQNCRLHARQQLLSGDCGTARADVEYTLARSRYMFDDLEAYMATAYSVRDRLIEEWNDTQCVQGGGGRETGELLNAWRWLSARPRCTARCCCAQPSRAGVGLASVCA